MGIYWTEDLATGIETIDNQHKGIFKRLNDLLESMDRAEGREQIHKILVYLSEYTLTHFAAEDDLMKKNNLNRNDYLEHKAQHERFMRDIAELKRKFREEGSTLALLVEILHELAIWLSNHISITDKKLAAFLKTHIEP